MMTTSLVATPAMWHSRHGAGQRRARRSAVEAEPAHAEDGEHDREAPDGADLLRDVGEAGAAADEELVVAVERPAVGDEQAGLLHQRWHQRAGEHAAADEA